VYQSQVHKATSALAASAVVAMIAGMLIFGLRVVRVPEGSATLISIDLRPRPSPPEPEREQARRPPRPSQASAPRGAPAPPNLRNQATQVVVPPPRLVLPLPAPIVVATQAGTGNAASSGVADRPGPGTGAGGAGNGFGGGGDGGEGEGVVTGPRQVAGKLRFSDMPEELLGPGEAASVAVRFTVGTDGRVSDCGVAKPSGKPGIDALACRLIEKRFRFRPARDAAGRRVPAVVVETHNWRVAPEQ